MITIAPEYQFGVAILLLVLVGSAFAALPLAARLTGGRGLGLALCLAPALGVLFTISAALVAYRFPIAQPRPFISIGLVVAVGLLLWTEFDRPPLVLPKNWLQILAGLVAALAFYFSAQANRLSLLFLDEPVHLGLTATIAEGNYPVRFPWSPDLASGYHYAMDLHAAVLTSASGLPVWIVAELQHPWLSLTLVLTAFGIVLYATGSRIGALAAAVVAAYSPGVIWLGWPALGQDGSALPPGFSEFAERLSAIGPSRYELSVGPSNLVFPQRTFGLALLALLVHAWTLRPLRRFGTAVAFGAGMGVLAVTEIGIFAVGMLALLIACAAHYVANARKGPLRQFAICLIPLLVATGLAITIGGPITDTVFGPKPADSGSLIAIRPRLDGALLNPLKFAEPTVPDMFAGAAGLRWIHVAVLGLVAAAITRNRHLIGLAAVGLSGGILFQSLVYTVHDDANRLITYSAFFSVLAIVGAVPLILGRLPSLAAAGAVVLLIAFAALPTLLPNLTAASRLTGNGVAIAPLVHKGALDRLEERSRYARELNDGESLFRWARRNLPAGSRVLSPWPGALTIATGRFGVLTPTLTLQNEPYAGPEYIDAWSTLGADALNAIDADYLHVTADAAETIQQLGINLSDRAGFLLVYDSFDSPTPARRHRVYSIVNPKPGDRSGAIAGLSNSLAPGASILLGDGISEHATAALAYELRDFTLIRTLEIPGHLRVPLAIEPPGTAADYALLPDWYRPLELGLTQDQDSWHGAGVRLYDLNAGIPWRGPIRGEWTEIESDSDAPIALLAFLPEGSALEIDRGGRVDRFEGGGGVMSLRLVPDEFGTRLRVINEGPAPLLMYRQAPEQRISTANSLPGVAHTAGWDGARIVIDLWWLSAGADTENLGAEWVIARPGAGPPDPNDADVPRWEAGLNLRAESDLIREFFTLATLRGAYLDPSTGQPVFSGAADGLESGTYVAYLYVVHRTAATRTAFMAIPLFKFEVGRDEPLELYSGIAALEPLDGPQAVWLGGK